MTFLRRLSPTILVLACLCGFLLNPTFPGKAAGPPIRVGISDNPPTVFLDPNGRPAGFTPELLNHIAELEGWKLDFSFDTFAKLQQRLKRGEIDLMVMAYTPERELEFDFNSQALTSRWGVVYLPEGTSINSLADLSGKRVAVAAKDVHASLFRQAAEIMDIPVQLVEVESHEEVFRQLQHREADAGVVNSAFGASRAEDYPVTPTPITFKPIEMMFAFAEGRRPEWSKTLDRYLQEGKADTVSFYQQLHRRWLGPLAKSKKQLPLTTEERVWLAAHPRVRIAFDGYFPPYSYLNEEGRPEGFSVDVLRELFSRLGIELELSPLHLWKDLYSAAQRREIDLVATMVDRPERREWFLFTEPYIFKSLVIVARSDDRQLTRREDLEGRRVALVRDYHYSQQVLEEFPAATPVWVDTMLDALNAVAIGQADACIIHHAAAESLRAKYQLGGLRYAAIYARDDSSESIAVRKDWPELAAILDKALDAISATEMLAIEQAWLPAPLPLGDQEVPLSAEERYWVKAHPVIRLGVHPDLVPLDFIDPQGSHQGIAADYLELLAPRLGLKFELVPTGNWEGALAKAASGEVDLLATTARTPEREKTLSFSAPFADFNRVVVTRSDAPFISSLEDIRAWRIAVPAESAHAQFLAERGVEATPYSNFPDGLVAVSGGGADAFIGNVATSAYWIRQLNLSNLKIAASLSVDTMHFAARKDWPLLSNILDKGLASISEEEALQIRQRWIDLDYSPGVPLKKLLSYLGGGLALVFLVGGSLLTWNRRLKREVVQRIAAEKLLAEKHRFEQLAAQISGRFVGISTQDVDREIIHSLEDLAHFAGVPSACLALVDDVETCCIDCTHVWHSQEALTGIEVLARQDAQKVATGAVSLQQRLQAALLYDNSEQVHLHLHLPTRCLAPGNDSQPPPPADTQLDASRIDLFRQIFTGALRQKFLQEQLSEYAEEAVNNNQEMRKLLDELNLANRELDAFAYSVSHDLRAPLRAVDGFSRILVEDFSPQLPEEAQGLLARVRRAAQQMGQLIDDLLAFSRLGRAPLATRNVDMGEMVRKIAAELCEGLEDRDIDLRIDELAVAQGDPKMIRQVWINLISNAIKYTQTRPQAVIEVGSETDPEDGEIYFIRDNGVGFDMRHVGKLFRVFQRLHGVEEFEGTGVGLAIVQRIIQRHGGSIWAEAEVGRGACFYFSLDNGIKTVDDPVT